MGLLPTHFRTLFNRLTQDCDSFVEADRARLITTSYHWLAEKPATDSAASSQKAMKMDSSASSETAVNRSEAESPAYEEPSVTEPKL